MSGTVIDKFVIAFGAETSAAEAGLKRFQSKLKGVRSGMDNLARGFFKAGGSLTGAGAGALLEFGSYQKGLAKIEGLVGISRDQLKAWDGDIKRIAVETATSSKSLTEALYFVTSAGLRGSDAMDVLEQSARAATAGLGDQTAIVDLATSAMNAYGPETLNAQQAVDGLVKAVELGKLAPEEMASAMGRALPLASALVVEFNEVAGVLAAMSKTGTSASEGVTQLNSLMQAIVKPADQATEKLAEVGLTAKDLRRIAADEGIFAMLETLQTKFGTGDEWIEALGEAVPNIRALRGVLDLMGSQKESNKQLLEDMGMSEGTTDRAFDAMAETIDFKFRQMMTKVKGYAIEMGELLQPAFEKMLRFGDQLAARWESLSPGVKKFIASIIALGPFLLGAGFALKAMSFALGGLSAALTITRGAIALLKASMVASKAVAAAFTASTFTTTIGVYALTVAAKVAAAAQWLWNAALYAMPIVGWIAAIVAAGYLIWRFRDQIVGFVQSALKALGEFFAAGARLIGSIIGWFTVDLFGAGRKLISTFWDGIKSKAKDLLDGVKNLFQKVRDFLPFSDAKTGPLADLTLSGQRFSKTFAAGVADGFAPHLSGALGAGLPSLLTPLPVGPAPQPVRQSSSSFTVSVDMPVTVNGGDVDEVGARLKKTVEDAARELIENYDSNVRA